MFEEKRRTVNFATNEKVSKVVAFIEPSSNMSVSERDSIWYRSSELENFKKSVRSTIRKRRTSRNLARRKLKEECIENSSSLISKGTDVGEFNLQDLSSDRGFELRLSAERQKNKYFAIQAVLEAQRRLKKKAAFQAKCGILTDKSDADNRLALVSARFTAEAREDALKLATIDFVTAYCDYTFADFALPQKQTRDTPVFETQGREKRVKLSI